MADDGEVLGAAALAGAALDAGGGFAGRVPAIVLLGAVHVVELGQYVERVHDDGDVDVLRARLQAVAAVGARHRLQGGQGSSVRRGRVICLRFIVDG